MISCLLGSSLPGCLSITVKDVREGTCRPYEQGDYIAIVCNNRIVQIISDPPGARISINEEYKGEAPLRLRYHGWYDIRQGYKRLVPNWIIEASPVHNGGCRKTRRVNPKNLPSRMFFDNRLCSRR